jgi:hypothetical protein
MAVSNKAKFADFVAFIYHCPVRGEDLTANAPNVSFHSSSSDCGMCGSHGESNAVINDCPCGTREHIVELSSW